MGLLTYIFGPNDIERVPLKRIMDGVLYDTDSPLVEEVFTWSYVEKDCTSIKYNSSETLYRTKKGRYFVGKWTYSIVGITVLKSSASGPTEPSDFDAVAQWCLRAGAPLPAELGIKAA